MSTNSTLPAWPIEHGDLKATSTTISFDPLGLLAILHNPRAAASTARLYGQNYLGIFRWPHTSTSRATIDLLIIVAILADRGTLVFQ